LKGCPQVDSDGLPDGSRAGGALGPGAQGEMIARRGACARVGRRIASTTTADLQRARRLFVAIGARCVPRIRGDAAMTDPRSSPSADERHRRWLYRSHPTGLVGPEHYELVEAPLDTALSEGEVLVRARYVSVDPYMRINQSRKPTYNELPHPLDTVQTAGVVGQVVASRAAVLSAGDWVEA
jgi:hypothetical protein